MSSYSISSVKGLVTDQFHLERILGGGQHLGSHGTFEPFDHPHALKDEQRWTFSAAIVDMSRFINHVSS
ncbi:hypothetical protein [Pseudomonas agarici]|uniref:hypothetical protein n=1 Tax=Pseudomonas agarici TaxID=46677 RepID=UPI00210CBD2C|nr:hypothetical protein [Pseudomonas agarici]